MKAGHDEYRIIDDPKEQGVRKPAEQRAANIGENNRKLQRMGGQALDDVIELRAEASSQARGFGFVPVLCFACLDLRGGQENNRVHQGARRASTALSCSQVMPPERSCSKLSNRRSSSARCAGVTGTSSGSRLSQSSPMSVKRSSGVSRAISSCVRVDMRFKLTQNGRGVQVLSAFLEERSVDVAAS